MEYLDVVPARVVLAFCLSRRKEVSIPELKDFEKAARDFGNRTMCAITRDDLFEVTLRSEFFLECKHKGSEQTFYRRKIALTALMYKEKDHEFPPANWLYNILPSDIEALIAARDQVFPKAA